MLGSFQPSICKLHHSSSVILNSISNKSREHKSKNKSQCEIAKSKYTIASPTNKKIFKLEPLTRLNQNNSMILKISPNESNVITRNKTLTLNRHKNRPANTMNQLINLPKNCKLKQMLIKHSYSNNTDILRNSTKAISSNIIIDFEKAINSERKFLKSIDDNSFLIEKHLNMVKIHLELNNVLFNELCISEFPSFRTIPEDINTKLLKKLNLYFNTLRAIFFDSGGYRMEDAPNWLLFNFSKLNSMYKKILKTQMVLYTSLFLLLQQINQENVYTNLNNHCLQLMKELSNSFIMFFSNFIYEELILYSNANIGICTNSSIISRGLGNNFNYKYSPIIKEYKKTPFTKNSITLLSINKNLLKCIQSIKWYNCLILKYLLCSQFSKAIEEITLKMEESCSPKKLCGLVINSLLFSLIDSTNKAESKSQLKKGDVNTAFPYLPPIKAYYALTLVVDLDETLIHFFQSKNKGIYLVRPYCFEFLEQLSQLYEIIVFTAGTKDYADKILNQIDMNNKYFKHRLYRDHVSSNHSFILKDLSKLGRELSKVVMVDNIEDNFSLQPNNGLIIKSWDGDIQDSELLDMTRVLLDLFQSHSCDVRDIIKRINCDIRKSSIGKNIYQTIQVSHYI